MDALERRGDRVDRVGVQPALVGERAALGGRQRLGALGIDPSNQRQPRPIDDGRGIDAGPRCGPGRRRRHIAGRVGAEKRPQRVAIPVGDRRQRHHDGEGDEHAEEVGQEREESIEQRLFAVSVTHSGL